MKNLGGYPQTIKYLKKLLTGQGVRDIIPSMASLHKTLLSQAVGKQLTTDDILLNTIYPFRRRISIRMGFLL